MRQKKKSEFLTEVELEFMTVLWQIGRGTVRDLIAKLAADRNLAYTSVATIMRIWNKKTLSPASKRERHLSTLRFWPRMPINRGR